MTLVAFIVGFALGVLFAGIMILVRLGQTAEARKKMRTNSEYDNIGETYLGE